MLSLTAKPIYKRIFLYSLIAVAVIFLHSRRRVPCVRKVNETKKLTQGRVVVATALQFVAPLPPVMVVSSHCLIQEGEGACVPCVLRAAMS